MNYLRIILFSAVVASLTGCASVYRTGETPDDVYAAPQPETHARGAAYMEGRSNSRADRYGGYNNSRNNNYYDYAEDRYLRLMAGNRMRWSHFDNYYYGFGPGMATGFGYGYGGYGFGHGYGMGYGYPHSGFGWYHNPWSYSSFNRFWMWNNYYNPYYAHTVVISPKTNPVIYNNVRNLRPSTYTNNNYYRNSVNSANNNRNNNRYTNPNYRTNNNVNSRNMRETNTNRPAQQRYNNQGNQNSRPERTYTPPSNTNRTVTPSAPSAPSRSGGVSRPSRND